MTHKERFVNTLKFKPVDRIPCMEIALWGQTIERWIGEGAPGNLNGGLMMGNAYFGQENYIEAIGKYKRAIELQPEEAMLYYNLGAAYSNNKDYEKAIVEYLKAVEINPKIGDAHYGLAIGFYHLEQYKSAWKHIRIAQNMGVDVKKDQLEAIKRHL